MSIRVLAFLAIAACNVLNCTAVAAEPALAVSAWSTYGVAGSPRTTNIAPGETVFISADIVGLAHDKDGQVTFELQVDFRGPNGLLEIIPSRTMTTPLPVGGDSIRQFASINISREMAAAKYIVRIGVRDKHRDKTITTDIPLTVSDARQLAILNLQLTRDAERRIHSGGCFFCGESAFIHYNAASLKITNGAVKFVNKLTLLDEQGGTLHVPPIVYTAEQTGFEPNSDHQLPIMFGMAMNRPGRFLAHIEVKDINGNQHFEDYIPIEVLTASAAKKPKSNGMGSLERR